MPSECGCMNIGEPSNCRYPALLEAARRVIKWWDEGEATEQLAMYAPTYPVFTPLRDAVKEATNAQ